MTASICSFNQAVDTCPICNGVFSENLKRIESDRSYTQDTTTYKECTCPGEIQEKLQNAISELHDYYEVADDDEEELISQYRRQKYLAALDEIVKEYKQLTKEV